MRSQIHESLAWRHAIGRKERTKAEQGAEKVIKLCGEARGWGHGILEVESQLLPCCATIPGEFLSANYFLCGSCLPHL